MKNHTTVICCIVLFSLNTLLFSQNNSGFLNFVGKVVDREAQPVKGVTIKLIKDNVDAIKLTTKKNGQFTFMIFFDGEYKIAISLAGCADMHLVVYASQGKGNIFPSYQMEVPLYSDTTTRVNVAMFKQPFLKLIFDGKENFIPDQEYDAQFKKNLLTAGNDNAPESPLTSSTPQITSAPAEAQATPIQVSSNSPKYSKKNYPPKFVFADTDKDKAISLLEINTVIDNFKKDKTSYKKDMVEAFIGRFFE